MPTYLIDDRSVSHYGALQGLDKKQTVEKFGSDQVKVWRRSYDIPPPECEDGSPMLPANDPKYAHLPETHHIKTESLKVPQRNNSTMQREKIISPFLFCFWLTDDFG